MPMWSLRLPLCSWLLSPFCQNTFRKTLFQNLPCHMRMLWTYTRPSLSSMVPHSQVLLNDHISIINNYENGTSQNSVMNSNPSIDESNYRYIIRCYKRYWREKLLSECIPLTPALNLINSCFVLFSYQFMQIKNTPNILFPNTT